MLWQQAGATGAYTVAPTPNPATFNFSVTGPADLELAWAEGTPGGAQFTFRLLDPAGTPVPPTATLPNAPTGQYTLEITYDASAGEPGAVSTHGGNAWVRVNSASSGAASALYQVSARRGTTPAPPPAPTTPPVVPPPVTPPSPPSPAPPASVNPWLGYLKGTLKQPPAAVYYRHRAKKGAGQTPLGGMLDFRQNNDVKTMASAREERLILRGGIALPFAQTVPILGDSTAGQHRTYVPPLRLNSAIRPVPSKLPTMGGRARR